VDEVFARAASGVTLIRIDETIDTVETVPTAIDLESVVEETGLDAIDGDANLTGLGLTKSVRLAAPPATTVEALAVAAEHFAFCPDNVWQGVSPFTLAGYAERLIDAAMWTFWWD